MIFFEHVKEMFNSLVMVDDLVFSDFLEQRAQ